MTAILGLSAFYHDSAAALVVDGKIVAAAQEERFTRRKHDSRFPRSAIDYCLGEEANGGRKVATDELDYVAYYEKPLLKFDRLLETYLAFAPRGFRSFRTALPVWLKEKLFLKQTLRRELPLSERGRFIFVEHHESHAASAFFPSPFERAALLTLDGVGEWSTTTLGVGAGNKIKLEAELEFPHSLGLLYSAFTGYCGFKVNSGEYKLMGLAPYGRPRYRDLILQHLIELKSDGSFWMDMSYFDYCAGLRMTNERFHRLFGGPPRQVEAIIEQRHMDLAASVQQVTEEAVLGIARELHRRTGEKNLAMAGGVALNCVANGRLLREGPFEKIWIQPAAGDAGGALGAALFVWHQLLEKPRSETAADLQQGSLLGPRYPESRIAGMLTHENAPFRHFALEDELLEAVVELLAAGRIVGWFSGRMEFGPRALGARSILGDPRNPTLQARMNVKIKFRESFRPFAPSVLRERASEYFEMNADQESPYMLHVAAVKEKHRTQLSPENAEAMANDPDLRKRVNLVRSAFPAVTHVDYSARVQTVDEARHGRYYRLLRAFERKTGCALLANTSFNVRGEPMVCTPAEAYRCFAATGLDALVLENYLVLKSDLPPDTGAAVERDYVSAFPAD
jgi:carbamoyltransferase